MSAGLLQGAGRTGEYELRGVKFSPLDPHGLMAATPVLKGPGESRQGVFVSTSSASTSHLHQTVLSKQTRCRHSQGRAGFHHRHLLSSGIWPRGQEFPGSRGSGLRDHRPRLESNPISTARSLRNLSTHLLAFFYL